MTSSGLPRPWNGRANIRASLRPWRVRLRRSDGSAPRRSCGEGTRVQASSMLYLSRLMLFNCVTYPTGSPTQLKQSAVRLQTEMSKYKQANQGIVRLEVSSLPHDGECSF